MFVGLRTILSNVLQRGLVNDTLYALAIKVSSAVCAFLLTVVIARNLGVGAMGVYFLCLSVVAMTSVICRAGLDNVFLKVLSSGQQGVESSMQDSYSYFTGLTVVFVFSLVGSSVLFFSSSVIALGVLKKPTMVLPLQLMSLSVVPLCIFNVNAMCLRGKRRYQKSILVQDLCVPFVGLIIGVPLMSVYGLVGAAIMYLGATVVSSILSIVWWRPYVTSYKFSRESLFEFWSAGKHLFLASVVNRAMVPWLPIFVIGLLTTSVDVGVYSAANRVAMIVAMIFVTISGVVSPQFATAYKQNQINRLQILSKNAAILSAVIVLPLGLVIMYARDEILLLFGEGFVFGKDILVVLVVGRIVSSCFGPQGHLLMMTNNEKYFKNSTLISVFVLMVTLYVFVKLFGIVGAAYSVSMSLVIAAFCYTYYVKKLLNLKCFLFGIVAL